MYLMVPSKVAYRIVASPIFKLSLQRLLFFLEKKYSSVVAKKTKLKIRKTLENQLSKNPEIAPVSDRLIDLGISEYRQLLVDKHKLIFFRIDSKNQQVVLLLVMDARQSIRKLLSEVNLLV